MGVMNHGRRGLLSIGNFATAAQLTLKALRLYDQLGILRPSYVDPESSYRYYHNDQLTRARLIRMMREADMPLATIRQVLAAAPTASNSPTRRARSGTTARAMISTSRSPGRSAASGVARHAAARSYSSAQPRLAAPPRVRYTAANNRRGTPAVPPPNARPA